jgi:hypothetical protein
VAKSSSGNYYAAKDGTVYKKEPTGGWSSNSGSGWQTVNKSTTQAASSAAHPESGMSQESLEAQHQSRQWGSQQSERTTQFQSAGGYYGGSRYGGGRRR